MNLNQASRPKNYRICVYSSLYAPIFSGEAIQVHELLQSLMKEGVSAFVLTGRYAGAARDETMDGVSIKRLGVLNTNLPFIRPLSLVLNTIFELFRRRMEFDILQLHSVGMFEFLLVFFAWLLGKHTLIKMTLMGSPEDPGTWPMQFWNRLRKLTYLYQLSFVIADGVISLSYPLTEAYRMKGLNMDKLWQIPQGVDVERFHPVGKVEKNTIRKRLGLRTNVKYLCFVGSFKQRKGADILIDIFVSLAKQYPELCLLVVGPDKFDDPIRSKRQYSGYSDKLKEIIHRAGLNERVIFTGMVGNVETYLQASDIFIFPSRREGFGAAIVEAMAVGLPCVLSELDGITNEITENGKTAIVISGESSRLYVDRISELLHNNKNVLEISALALQRVRQEYTMQAVAKKYIGIYQELLSKGKASI